MQFVNWKNTIFWVSPCAVRVNPWTAFGICSRADVETVFFIGNYFQGWAGVTHTHTWKLKWLETEFIFHWKFDKKKEKHYRKNFQCLIHLHTGSRHWRIQCDRFGDGTYGSNFFFNQAANIGLDMGVCVCVCVFVSVRRNFRISNGRRFGDRFSVGDASDTNSACSK